MITLELDDETAGLLAQLVNRDHQDAGQLIKRALADYWAKPAALTEQPELLADFAGLLSDSPSFDGDPLEIQKAMRDEWN